MQTQTSPLQASPAGLIIRPFAGLSDRDLASQVSLWSEKIIEAELADNAQLLKQARSQHQAYVEEQGKREQEAKAEKAQAEIRAIRSNPTAFSQLIKAQEFAKVASLVGACKPDLAKQAWECHTIRPFAGTPFYRDQARDFEALATSFLAEILS